MSEGVNPTFTIAEPDGGTLRHFRIEKDLIHWHSDAGYADVFPLSIVEEVHLYHDKRDGEPVRTCRIVGRPDRRLFFDTAPIGDDVPPQQRNEDFDVFIRALLTGISDAAPRAQFVAGNRMRFRTGILIGTAWVFLAAAAVWLYLAGSSLDLKFMVLLFVMGTMGVAAFRMLRGGPGKPFDPRNPPANLLPANHAGDAQ